MCTPGAIKTTALPAVGGECRIGNCKHLKLLLFEAAGNPEDDHGTDDGRAELTDEAAPFNVEEFEEPTAHKASEDTEQKIEHAAEAAATHQLTGSETGEDANDN